MHPHRIVFNPSTHSYKDVQLSVLFPRRVDPFHQSKGEHFLRTFSSRTEKWTSFEGLFFIVGEKMGDKQQQHSEPIEMAFIFIY
jgi:hypothetical protein